MIMGIGTDLIEIQRVIKACNRESFCKRIYTEKEWTMIEQDKRKAASNFAVKEAVVKVFGTGFDRISPIDIEVLRDENGKPFVILHGAAIAIAKDAGVKRIHVTITNTKDLVSAFAIGEN